jgi:hydroxyethylthiazole kinase-like uncharacterized protein yjeF
VSLDSDAWSVAAIRAAEEAVLSAPKPPDLMARAASGLAQHCLRLLTHRGGAYGTRVVALVGRGNNGGDALYAAAILARRGCAVTAIVASDDVERAHSSGLAAFRAAGGTVVTAASEVIDGRTELVLDGLVGIGARGSLWEPAAGLARAAADAHNRGTLVVAVDLPSGIDADTGAVPDPACTVSADLTVTFGCPKPGLLLYPAARFVGDLAVVDIGLAPALARQGGPAVRVYTSATVREAWPLLGAESDKYDRGVVGIAAGSATYPGAAVLAVSGALAGSVGMVRYVGSAATQVLAAHPEVVATDRLSDAGRVQAWVVGSGLGTDSAAREAVDAALDRRLPTVIDADGLTTLAELIVKDGPAAVRRRPLLLGDSAVGEPTAILTPHRRELGRLLDACAGSLPGREPDDPLATARALSELLNVTLLVKGSHTLIATPGHTAYVNVTATPALATAGTGDVLAGLLGSLLAGGMAPHEAAASAAYLHGAAGVRAERDATVTATRVAAALPEVVAETVYDGRPFPARTC